MSRIDEMARSCCDAPFLDVDFGIRRDDFALDVRFQCMHSATALFGASGAGKTTVLDAIAGLLAPDRGEIALCGETVFSSERGISLAPERRGIGYVFQDGQLFPHMSVKKNLAYGARGKRAGVAAPSFSDVVDLLELQAFLFRRPAALSGGQRQRVAIGRAILSGPRFLLFDEPLASLDVGLRDRILPYLMRVRDAFGIPFLYVSHSIAEIVEVAGEAVVIDHGRVIGQGEPLEVLSQPEVFPVADRLGIENALEVEVVENRPERGYSVVKCGGARLSISHVDAYVGSRLIVTIRADEILLAVEEPRGLSARNVLPGEIRRVEEVKDNVLVYLDVGAIIVIEVTPGARRELKLEPGRRAFAVVKSHSFRLRGLVGKAGEQMTNVKGEPCDDASDAS